MSLPAKHQKRQERKKAKRAERRRHHSDKYTDRHMDDRLYALAEHFTTEERRGRG